MSGERTRILVVDDEPHIGLILRTRLEQGPFEVLLASDSIEAFRLLAAHHDVSLVILDIMLPGLSGIQILSQLRGDPAWSAVPVIVLTAAGQDAQLREAEALGVVAVMTKPFSPRRLYERVVTLLGATTSSSRPLPS